MKSGSFSFSNDEASRFAKHRMQDFYTLRGTGFGEVLAGKNQVRGSVIDYENFVRKIMKMTTRPKDAYYNYYPPTQP